MLPDFHVNIFFNAKNSRSVNKGFTHVPKRIVRNMFAHFHEERKKTHNNAAKQHKNCGRNGNIIFYTGKHELEVMLSRCSRA